MLFRKMASSEGFPVVDAEKELNPGRNKDVQVDPISSEVAASKVLQSQPSKSSF